MTCREFHAYWEDPRMFQTFLGSSELSEHAGDCPGCNRYMEMQKELAMNLRLASRSVPQFPASLDRAVLANYRRYVAERKAATTPVPLGSRIRPLSVLAWAAAFAAALLIGQQEMALLFPGTNWLDADRHAAAQTTKPPQPPNIENRRQVAAGKNRTKEQTFSSRQRQSAAFRVPEQESLSPAFSSLLYCDQLSCGGDLELIRVELPSTVLRSTPASRRANLVSADVLVGSDGIARAIRIVE